MKSWEVYDRARKVLHKEKMLEIYGNRSSRMINYWAQDPKCCADPKRNPIDRLEKMVQELAKVDGKDVAIAVVRRLAGSIGLTIVSRKEAVPDKDTLQEEIIDDMPCLVAYQNALLANDLEEVDRTEAELKRELAENRVKFLEERSR